MTWALKRQIFFLFLFLIFASFFGFLVIYPYFNRAPSCTDGRKNGDESGVDCGGSCARACYAEVNDVSVIWSRAFEVVPGRYNALAYLENKNTNTAVEKIRYRFRFTDKDNVYIGERDGEASIPPGGKFAIFEPAIEVGNAVPVYTNFQFIEKPVWLNVSKDKIEQLKVLVSNIKLENEKTSPKLSATVKNNSLFYIPEVTVVAVLYDASHNAVNISQTYIDLLRGGESKLVNFTWPTPMRSEVVYKEVMPIYNVFGAKIK